METLIVICYQMDSNYEMLTQGGMPAAELISTQPLLNHHLSTLEQDK
jgi:hypothetical protein